MWTLIILVAVFALAMMGDYVARQKNRPSGEGVVFGLLLGPIGLIVVACLPTLEERPAPKTKQ